MTSPLEYVCAVPKSFLHSQHRCLHHKYTSNCSTWIIPVQTFRPLVEIHFLYCALQLLPFPEPKIGTHSTVHKYPLSFCFSLPRYIHMSLSLILRPIVYTVINIESSQKPCAVSMSSSYVSTFVRRHISHLYLARLQQSPQTGLTSFSC
jgi:hypothetical protein